VPSAGRRCKSCGFAFSCIFRNRAGEADRGQISTPAQDTRATGVWGGDAPRARPISASHKIASSASGGTQRESRSGRDFCGRSMARTSISSTTVLLLNTRDSTPHHLHPITLSCTSANCRHSSYPRTSKQQPSVPRKMPVSALPDVQLRWCWLKNQHQAALMPLRASCLFVKIIVVLVVVVAAVDPSGRKGSCLPWLYVSSHFSEGAALPKRPRGLGWAGQIVRGVHALRLHCIVGGGARHRTPAWPIRRRPTWPTGRRQAWPTRTR
jgi:hypothetical protein